LVVWVVCRAGADPGGGGAALRNTCWGRAYESKTRKPDTVPLWWIRDRAGHGSTWKVFEQEKGTGDLLWVFDADEFGDKIDGKHKGPIGRIIRWKDTWK
jgi:hypothetical protein